MLASVLGRKASHTGHTHFVKASQAHRAVGGGVAVAATLDHIATFAGRGGVVIACHTTSAHCGVYADGATNHRLHTFSTCGFIRVGANWTAMAKPIVVIHCAILVPGYEVVTVIAELGTH